MSIFFPRKDQWKRWSAPSKLTYIGTLAGVIGLGVTLATIFFGETETSLLRSNEQLFRDSKIRFEQYESNVRTIITSADIAFNYIATEYPDTFPNLAALVSTDLEELRNDALLKATELDLRDVQDIVIAIGFVKTDERALLVAVDNRVREITSLSKTLSSSMDNPDNQVRLIKTMIASLQIPEEQKDIYLQALEILNPEERQEFFENFTKFVAGISVTELKDIVVLLQHNIALKRLTTDDDRITYVLTRIDTGFVNSKALNTVQVDLLRSNGLIQQVGRDHFTCGQFADDAQHSDIAAAECPLDAFERMHDSEAKYDQREQHAVCVQSTGQQASGRTLVDGTWQGCALEQIFGPHACASDFTGELIAHAKSLVGISPSIEDAEKTNWTEWLDRGISVEGGETGTDENEQMTLQQLTQLIRMLSIERAKMAMLDQRYNAMIGDLRQRKSIKNALADRCLTKESKTAILAEAAKPRLGVVLSANGATGGILVDEIVPGSSVDGKLRPGDVITKFNGTAIADREALENIIASQIVGARVKLDLVREGLPLSIEVGLKSNWDD